MQEITLIGRLGRDAAIHETANGKKFLSFTVAADGRWKGETLTSWYDVLTYDIEKYEKMVPYLTKGSGVVVVGELYAELEVGKDGIARCRRAVTADSVRFLPKSGNSNTTVDGSQPIAKTSSTRKPSASVSDTPDDIPMTTQRPPVSTGTVVTASTSEVSGGDVDDLPF